MRAGTPANPSPTSRAAIFKLGVFASLLVVCAVDAQAELPARPAPSPGTILRLNQQHHGGNWLRVTLDSTRLELRARPVRGALLGMLVGGVSAVAVTRSGDFYIGGALAGALGGGVLGNRMLHEEVYQAPPPSAASPSPSRSLEPMPAAAAVPDTASSAITHVDPTAAVDAPSVPRDSRSPLSPAAALAVGLAATAVPTLLVYAVTSKDSRAEDVGLFVGVATGVIAGPAVGLWSGGRGDLAKRGLIIRSAGTAIGLGAMGVASATWENGAQAQALTFTLAILGVAGGLMAAGSMFHDLAITPSATGQRRRLSLGLGVRSDGLLALSVRF